MARKQKRDKKTHEKCHQSVLTFSGPNDITVFKDDADLVDLPAKLVARYSAKVSLSAALCSTCVTGSKDQACFVFDLCDRIKGSSLLCVRHV